MRTLKAFKEMWNECTEPEKVMLFQVLFTLFACMHVFAMSVFTAIPLSVSLGLSVYFQLRNKK